MQFHSHRQSLCPVSDQETALSPEFQRKHKKIKLLEHSNCDQQIRHFHTLPRFPPPPKPKPTMVSFEMSRWMPWQNALLSIITGTGASPPSSPMAILSPIHSGLRSTRSSLALLQTMKEKMKAHMSRNILALINRGLGDGYTNRSLELLENTA